MTTISATEHPHAANWRKWLGHLKDREASGLELGIWRGESSLWFLENILTHPEAMYFGVDTFEGSDEHRLAGIDCSTLEGEARARLAPFSLRAWIFKGPTHLNLARFNKESMDFIYVDAAHDAMNVIRDIVLTFELLKVGGVMILDDYKWEVMPDEIDRPKIAIDAFLACYGRRVEVIGLGWQVALLKTK